jgi:hypothetical protein
LVEVVILLPSKGKKKLFSILRNLKIPKWQPKISSRRRIINPLVDNDKITTIHYTMRRSLRSTALLILLAAGLQDSFAFLVNVRTRATHQPSVRLPSSKTGDETTLEVVKERLFTLISSTPSNAPTSKQTTEQILSTARELEALCPTPSNEVIPKLAGNWELLWTAQDLADNDEWGLGQLRKWIK